MPRIELVFKNILDDTDFRAETAEKAMSKNQSTKNNKSKKTLLFDKIQNQKERKHLF